MNWDLVSLRARKTLFALCHPACWRALWRGIAPSIEHGAVLARIDCDLVLDVGANCGQFTSLMRIQRPHVPVHAYEPLPTEADLFRWVHGKCAKVVLHQLALGDKGGTADIHVSARADSSSLLPISELQTNLFPHTGEVAVQQIEVATLDSLAEHWRGARRALLKLDVQGFELCALRGAEEALKHCRWVYAECSEIPLYAGQALRAEVTDFLTQRGFREAGHFNPQVSDGRLIQADYLFERTEARL